MMSYTLCPFLLVVFLTGRAVVSVNASDNEIRCGNDNCCQAMAKLMTAVNDKKEDEQAACQGLNEKIDRQAKEMEDLKEKLDRNLASTAAIATQLERLSAHMESERAAGNVDKLLQSIYGAEFGPRDCTDIREMGFNISGIYRIYPGSVTRRIETDVYCDFNSSAENWLVFQRRRDGSQNFDRSWREYERGFGVLDGEFWLGNEKLSLLTMNKEYKLRIEMEDFKGVKLWAEYSTFSVKPASDKYRLTAYGTSGTAGLGDILAHHNGKQFGTKDADNGLNLTSCRNPISGGWWFNACLHGNLNSRYRSIYWYYSNHMYYSLRATEMKIAPSSVTRIIRSEPFGMNNNNHYRYRWPLRSLERPMGVGMKRMG